MSRLLLPFVALFFAVGLLLTGSGAFFTLLPLHARLIGFSALELGVIGAVYYIGFVGGCFAGPWLVRRVGHMRVFAALASLSAVLALIFPLTDARVVWWLARALSGFAMSGLYMSVESWLNGETPNEARGRVFAIYAIINLSVFSFGQLLVGLGDPAGATLFSLVAILFSLSILPLMLTRGTAPTLPSAVVIDLGRLFRLAPAGAAGALVTGFANAAFWAMGPIYAVACGFSVSRTAVFMALVGFGAAAAQWPWGRWSDHTDRRRILLLQGTLAAAIGTAIAVFGSEAPMLVLAAAYGACSMPLNSVSVAHVNDHAAPGEAVVVSGGLNLLYGIGAVVGPLAAAALMTAGGPAMLFAMTAAGQVCFIVFLALRLRRYPAVPAAAKEAFVPVPNASPAAYALDPRHDGAEAAPAKDFSSRADLG